MKDNARHKGNLYYFRWLTLFLTMLAATDVMCLQNPFIDVASARSKSSLPPQAVSWPPVTHVVSHPVPALKDDQSAGQGVIVIRNALPTSRALADARGSNQATSHDYGIGVIAPLSSRFSAYGQVNRLNNEDADDTSGHIGIQINF